MSADTVDSVAGAQVKAIYERWEQLEEDKKAISDDLRDLFAEAKGNGFNSKLMRKAFAIHKAKQDRPAEVEEDEAVIDLYLHALEAPRVGARPAHAREAREDRAKARMSESMADHKEFSNELAAAGLISAEAAAENVAIADAMARKFCNGPIDHDPETGEVIEMDRDVEMGSEPKPPVSAESARKAIPETEDGSASHAEVGESPAPSSTTSLADARLLSRITAARTKGIDVMDGGDSARVDRLVREGALIRDNGRLYAAAFRRSA